MDILTGLGLAIPAGLNAYIPLFAVAVAEHFGWISLAEPYSLLGEWWVIALIALLLAIEFVADKVPAVDHVNDAIQTFVRPAAGGLLFVATASPAAEWAHPAVWVVAGVLVAGSVHAAKATTRPAVNASTGGAGAPVASLAEDATALFATVVAIAAPALVGVVVLGLVVVFVRRRRRTAAGPR